MKLYEIAERIAFWLVIALVLTLLLVPVATIALTSFTPANFPTIPQGEYSLKWYGELVASRELMGALYTSFVVAAVASILAGLVGTITAFGFVRSELPYKEELATVMLLPLMISPVITGLAIVRYAGEIGLPSGYPTLILGHSILTLPYVFLITRSRLLTFDEGLEDASRIMGANSVETAVNVTLPIISPSVISGVLIAFVVSFGEFTATQFLISVDTTTVPVIIFTELRAGLSPTISALSTVLMILMVLGAVLSGIISR